jgi:benzoate/toluate 1,2-dioxygenase reductase component
VEAVTGSSKRETVAGGREYRAELVNRRWLSPGVFELELARPRLFEFLPGQRIRLLRRGTERDYSLVSTPGDPVIALCVRKIEGGGMSPFLASANFGSTIRFIGPQGYFTFRGSSRPAVFVATGVGVAPFVSMVRSGVRILTMLHGVRVPAELYYEPLFRGSAKRYVPCLSRASRGIGLPVNAFEGRVTEYLKSRLEPGPYDFYVCGRSEMVRDVTLLVDELFPGSLVYSEIFY